MGGQSSLYFTHMQNEKDLVAEGQDHADEMWAQGLCLTCSQPNDRKDQNLRTCSACEAKEVRGPE